MYDDRCLISTRLSSCSDGSEIALATEYTRVISGGTVEKLEQDIWLFLADYLSHIACLSDCKTAHVQVFDGPFRANIIILCD